MKKLALSLAIVLGMCVGAYAQGGLFQYGEKSDDNGLRGLRGNPPGLPGGGGHGGEDDVDAPLAGGALLLIGFGAAYALKKRNEK